MTLKQASPWLAGVFLVTISALFAQTLKQNEALQRHEALEVAAERIKQRISTQVSAIYAVRALFRGSENVTREEFRQFAESIGIFGRARGMQGLGFALHADAGTSQSAISSRLLRDYAVDRLAWPNSNLDHSFPIVFLEPDDERNRAALGYDMYTDATRRQAMDRAWNENRDIATRPVTLVQEIDNKKQVGFLIYLPLFESSASPASEVDEKRPIRGFVYAAFRAGDLLQTVLQEKPAVKVGIRAYSDKISDENLLYANAGSIINPSIHKIEVAGHDWILKLEDRGQPSLSFLSPWKIVLLLGFLLSAAFAYFIFSQLERAELAERATLMAKERAQEKDILLKEMTHRLKNVISRIVSVARMSAPSAATKDDFVASLTSRLQAMAAAQELLAKSDGQRTTIRALVRKEFEILFGPEASHVKINGPRIEIDESQSQALGLIVHELATNSTKYGALSNDGRITLDLSLENNGQSTAGLRWVESNIRGTADFSNQGFGSKLMKMMAEGQLRGKIDRRVASGEVHISILFPVSQQEANINQRH